VKKQTPPERQGLKTNQHKTVASNKEWTAANIKTEVVLSYAFPSIITSMQCVIESMTVIKFMQNFEII